MAGSLNHLAPLIVDRKLVEHVANLASLELSPDEVSYYEVQLGKVLGFISQLNEISSAATSSLDRALDTKLSPTPERQDELKPSLAPEIALSEAPSKQGSAFQVPRIIE